VQRAGEAEAQGQRLAREAERAAADHAHDARELARRLEEEEARMWPLLQRAEAAEARAAAVEAGLNEAHRRRDAAQDQLANTTASLSLLTADKDAELTLVCQHTSSIRQHTSAYVSIRQHTSAYVSICQHTFSIRSAYAELMLTADKDAGFAGPRRMLSIR
jgi:hypothetical protein